MNESVDLRMVLQMASVALMLALFLPRFLVVLGWRKLEHGFRGGSEELAAYWDYKIDEDLIGQLAALGFRPVGINWERMNGGRTYWAAVFVSETERSFAMLYPNDQIMPRRAAFLSVSNEGAVVYTKNYHGGIMGQEKDFIAGSPGEKEPEHHSADSDAESDAPAGLVEMLRKARKTDRDFRAPLDEVLAEHRRCLSRCFQARDVTSVDQDFQSFLEVQQKFYAHPFVRRVHRSGEILLLAITAFSLSIIPGALACCLGSQHPAPWIALNLECVIGLVMRYGLSSAQLHRILRSVPGDKPKPISELKES
jgi:hypothetical protein